MTTLFTRAMIARLLACFSLLQATAPRSRPLGSCPCWHSCLNGIQRSVASTSPHPLLQAMGPRSRPPCYADAENKSTLFRVTFSKSAGYGPEESSTVFELTYNYGRCVALFSCCILWGGALCAGMVCSYLVRAGACLCVAGCHWQTCQHLTPVLPAGGAVPCLSLRPNCSHTIPSAAGRLMRRATRMRRWPSARRCANIWGSVDTIQDVN